MKKKRLGPKGTKTIVRIVLVIIFFIFLISIIRIVAGSIFFQRKAQLRLVAYGPQTTFFSFGLTDNTNYAVSFPADARFAVPGGLGNYRVGAIGKLVSLEKNPDLITKTFSTATGSFVDFYLLSDSSEIYYGNEAPDKPKLPSLSSILFDKSNMNIFERVYLASIILKRGQNSISPLPYSPTFAEDYQGYFFDPVFRQERLNVQLIYSEDYDSAVKLSQIIEGEGIRVGDISYKNEPGSCIIAENGGPHSETAKALARFFSCPLKSENTAGYDIIFTLGEREKAWYVPK